MKSKDRYQLEHQKLVDEWKELCEDAITDGLVDYEKYIKAPVRIVYLLKEVNGGKEWDLCEFLHEGGRSSTWDNIARWTEGIFHLDENLTWSDLKQNNKSRREEYLPQIGAINIKKTPGKSVSNNKEVYDIAASSENVELLRAQIALCDPEIIICCGTSDFYFRKISEFDHSWDEQTYMTKRGIWFAWEGSRLVIDYTHPEARTKGQFLYYPIIDALREISSRAAQS